MNEKAVHLSLEWRIIIKFLTNEAVKPSGTCLEPKAQFEEETLCKTSIENQLHHWRAKTDEIADRIGRYLLAVKTVSSERVCTLDSKITNRQLQKHTIADCSLFVGSLWTRRWWISNLHCTTYETCLLYLTPETKRAFQCNGVIPHRQNRIKKRRRFLLARIWQLFLG